jgi:hypothetical protein
MDIHKSGVVQELRIYQIWTLFIYSIMVAHEIHDHISMDTDLYKIVHILL